MRTMVEKKTIEPYFEDKVGNAVTVSDLHYREIQKRIELHVT